MLEEKRREEKRREEKRREEKRSLIVWIMYNLMKSTHIRGNS